MGIVLLVAGLGLLGWVGWQYVGTGITSNQKMGEAQEALRDQWKVGEKTPPASGDPIVLLRIPKLGADWEKPVVEGIDTATTSMITLTTCEDLRRTARLRSASWCGSARNDDAATSSPFHRATGVPVVVGWVSYS
ncbi:hypothetical protein E0H75_41690 [Kribbella capetownensis]|uniref:Sortase n=1 Tax=Kribbella capetownensis TaxID=1572659 RepID=A0A4R0IUU6_9ACTN|nr:hypothetical protein [Kribbella capetownensis]TCC35296.1 hypothetical protein E0H75_41690 [Kribbella capetownensis]